MTEQCSLGKTASWTSDLRWLLLLFVLVAPLRVWLFFNTEVPARDCIGFVRYALQFESQPWPDVLRHNQQHPGYAFMIWVTSLPVRAVAGDIDPAIMQTSAQLVSGLAALLLLAPTYFLGKALFDRSVGFWASLLLQYLPTSGHHLSDGISEALFLLLVTTALLWGVLAVRRRCPWRFALCGLFCGLAYLTRPEGALVLPAVGLALAGVQFIPAWRWSWSRFALCGTSLALSSVVVGGLYVLATGRLSNKPAAETILKLAGEKLNQPTVPAATSRPRVLTASIFGAFFEKSDVFSVRLGRSLRALFMELNQSFHYIAGIPALLGLWWSWGRLRKRPDFFVLAGYLLLHTGVLIALAMVASYVSDRHVMPLVVGACFFVVVGIQEAARRCLARWATPTPSLSASPLGQRSLFWATAFLILLVAIAAPKTIQRLHGNRAGNLAAGNWLAGRLQEGDIVDDDHAWSHYYAGMVFKEGKDKPLPAGYVPTSYVVFTRSHDRSVEQVRRAEEARVRQSGPIVFHWPAYQDVEKASVIVVATPRDWNTHPWHVIP